MTHPINRAVADTVSAFDNLLGRRKARANEGEDDDKEMEDEGADVGAMDDEEPSGNADAMEDEEEVKAEDEEKAQGPEEKSASYQAGFAKGAAAENARISNILNSKEATGKGAVALKVALNQKFSEDEARAFLADTPTQKGGFKHAMAKTDTKVGSDAGRPSGQQAINDSWAAAIAKVSPTKKPKS